MCVVEKKRKKGKSDEMNVCVCAREREGNKDIDCGLLRQSESE